MPTPYDLRMFRFRFLWLLLLLCMIRATTIQFNSIQFNFQSNPIQFVCIANGTRRCYYYCACSCFVLALCLLRCNATRRRFAVVVAEAKQGPHRRRVCCQSSPWLCLCGTPAPVLSCSSLSFVPSVVIVVAVVVVVVE